MILNFLINLDFSALLFREKSEGGKPKRRKDYIARGKNTKIAP